MEFTVIDLNNVCRTCKSDAPEMKSLYHTDLESENENPSLNQMLMACASVQVDTEDGLPKLICRSCIVQLKSAYSFKQQCEKTDVFLRDYLQNLEKVNIKEEMEITDAEFSWHLNGEMNSGLSDESCEKNVIDDAQIHPPEQREGDMDTGQVDNITTYECRTCSKVFYTLEGIRCHKRRQCNKRTHTGKAFKRKQGDRSDSRLNKLHRSNLSHSKRKIPARKVCSKNLTRFEDPNHRIVPHLTQKPFSCSNCNRPFNRADHLQNHVTCCNGTNVYVCDICNKNFLREDSLEVHKRLHVNKALILPTTKKLNNIEEDDVKVDSDQKTDHSDDREDLDVIIEPIEPEVEVSEDNDQEKIDEIAQISNNEVYAKKDLPQMLPEQVGIKEELHIEDDEDDDEVDEYVSETDNRNNYEFDNNAHSECQSMKESPLRSRGRPKKRQVSYKSTGRVGGRPLKLKIKTETDTEEHLECSEKHTEEQGLKLYECETCSKQFGNSNSLKKHKQSHEEKHMTSEDFDYDLCDGTVSRDGHSTEDEDEMFKDNSAEQKFECQYCPKVFTAARYRNAHMKRHFGERNIQCRTCEKKFTSKSYLTKHMKVHDDITKKFLCSECGQRFIRLDYLDSHMRRHHGKKPFKCKFCGKGFLRTTDLTIHERYHTGEKTHLCVICGKGFGRPYNLTVHMRTHTGEKPYHCTYCDAAFAQGNDLKAHIRRHTGERYQCELCPENFLRGYLLTQHKRTVHGLNIVSNIRRLLPVTKLNPDDPPPVLVPLPAPIVIPTEVMPGSITYNMQKKRKRGNIVIKPRQVI